MRPLAEAAANRMEHSKHIMHKKTNQNVQQNSTTTANQQRWLIF